MDTTLTNTTTDTDLSTVFAAYAADASRDNLRALHTATAALLGETVAAVAGQSVAFPTPVFEDAFLFKFPTGTHFTQFRARFDRNLTPTEIEQSVKIIRYAVRDWIGGPRLAEPLVHQDATGTRLEFYYDSAEGAISQPDTLEMFDHAATFLEEGTPIHISNRAGIGTMGTRRYAGIGVVSVIFEILPA